MIDSKLLVRLRRSPASVVALSKELDASRAEITNALARLEATGRIKSTQAGWVATDYVSPKPKGSSRRSAGSGRSSSGGDKAIPLRRVSAPPLPDSIKPHLNELLGLALGYGMQLVLMSPKAAAKRANEDCDLTVTASDMHAVLDHGANDGWLRPIGTHYYCLPEHEQTAQKAWQKMQNPRPRVKPPKSKSKAKPKQRRISDSDWQAGPWWWRHEKPGGFHM